MSNVPLGSGVAGPTEPGRGLSSRAPLLAGGILVALVAVVLIAHGANGGTKAASSTMNMTTTTSGSMAGMAPTTPAPPMGSSKVMTIRGATLPAMQTSGAAMPTAMAMVPLGNATWEGMSIQARTSAPATFVLFDNGSQQVVKPTPKSSFHLMVLLSDASTGVAIPYSSVWATVTKGGKKIFDEELWPMVSRYMGPHYGNNVSLPSAGLYHLTLLVSPPEAARHLEYKGLWLAPHRVSMSFRWVPKT